MMEVQTETDKSETKTGTNLIKTATFPTDCSSSPRSDNKRILNNKSVFQAIKTWEDRFNVAISSNRHTKRKYAIGRDLFQPEKKKAAK